MIMTKEEYDRLKGCFFGLVVGDALGVPLEFSKRDKLPLVTEMIGGGPFALQPGEWTDDTSMMLCIAQSLIDNDGFDPRDIMDKFTLWYTEGMFSHNGKCFDIGDTCKAALKRYAEIQNPYAGDFNHYSSGNGSIMRLAPIPIYYYPDKDKILKFSYNQSLTTHASNTCLIRNEWLGEVLYDLFRGEKDKVLKEYGDLTVLERNDISSSGYVVDTFNAAMWAVLTTKSFEDALVLAVNLADDSDTVGAVTGQIAGAMYGFSSIPEKWLQKIVWYDIISETFEDLVSSHER